MIRISIWIKERCQRIGAEQMQKTPSYVRPGGRVGTTALFPSSLCVYWTVIMNNTLPYVTRYWISSWAVQPVVCVHSSPVVWLTKHVSARTSCLHHTDCLDGNNLLCCRPADCICNYTRVNERHTNIPPYKRTHTKHTHTCSLECWLISVMLFFLNLDGCISGYYLFTIFFVTLICKCILHGEFSH